MLEYSKSITAELEEELAKEAPIAEREGKLTERQLAVIYEQKWFKMFVPKSFGGLEYDLLEGLRLEENLARIDGSLGWTVTLCSGATLFVGFLQEGVARSIFADNKVCFGGSGMTSGTAELTDDGYVVNGDWRYATGAPHNTVFTANCLLTQQDMALKDAEGKELVRSFFFFPQEVEVRDDWQAMGLMATAGHSFSASKLHLPKERSFHLVPEAATIDDPLYRYPFFAFAEATLAVNTLGMAQHFLQLCGAHFELKKMSGRYGTDVISAEDRLLSDGIGRLNRARQSFYEAVARSWNAAKQQHGRDIQPDLFAPVGEEGKKLVRAARDSAFQLFPYTGMYGANPASEINRVWRDIFTASQHSLLL